MGSLTCCSEQLYAYRDAYGSEKEAYVEFVDVGGHPKYEISRGVFYNDVQGRIDRIHRSCWHQELMTVTGIVFVHDLSNARSYDHLKIWLRCVHVATAVYGLQADGVLQ